MIPAPARPSTLAQIPDGLEGIRQTLNLMAQYVRWGKTVPVVSLFAGVLIRDLPPKAWYREIRSIFHYVRDEVRYTLDINEIETVRDPLLTLEYGFGDCDDKCVLLACLLECVGHSSRFAALSFDPDPDAFSHVIVETRAAAEGRWIPLDPTEPYPAGWCPPGVTGKLIKWI